MTGDRLRVRAQCDYKSSDATALSQSFLQCTRQYRLRNAEPKSTMNGLLYFAAALAMLYSSISAEKQAEDTVYFQEIIRDMEQKSEIIKQHPFLDFLKDETIPARRRLTFAPYLTFLVMSLTDIVDTWLYVPNPQNELEERINIFIREDDFHYNLLLHDIESVLGYTLDRYGSYTAVMRHIWGDDSRAVREYIYAWLDCLNRYKDPIITLATFEAIEVGAQPIIEATYSHVYLPEPGMKRLLYFGQTHVDLEMNHTQFNWFNEEEAPVLPLGNIEITAQQRDQALEVSEEMYSRTCNMYDAFHALALAEDSIWPEKYMVEGYPNIRDFPSQHPNRLREHHAVKDEL